MVRLFPGGPIGNDVGLTPGSYPGGGDVPEPQVGPSGARPGGGDGDGMPGRAPLGPTGKPETSLKGAVGTANFAGFLRDLGEYNPRLEGRDGFMIYEKMRRSDADVRAALLACKLPIRAAEFQIVPGVKENEPGFALAKQIADQVRENLLGGLESPTSVGTWVTQNFETVKENALLCLDFGCAAHEDLWHVDGDKVRLRKLAPRLPYTFYRYHVDEDGESLLYLEQYGYRGNNFVNVLVPAEKIAYFVNDMEGAYFYGRSVLRAAYMHWYMKSQIYKIDCIAIERNGLGVPTIKQGPNVSVEDRKAAQQWVQMLAAHESTGLSLPNGWEFLLTGVTGRVRDPSASIQHHSEMIMRSVLANFLSLGTTQTGSRALGGSMRDFFYLSLEAISHKIDETISNTSIRRLVDYNYKLKPEHKDLYPRLETSDIIVINPLELLEICKDVGKFDVDLLQPDDDTENWIRKKAGLPPKSKTPRPRWAPITTRLQEQEEGEVPVEPGTKLDKEGKPIAQGPGSSPPRHQDTKQPGQGQANGKTQASEAVFLNGSMARSPDGPITPNRELKPFEKKHDFAGHVARADTTARQVARVLRADKPATIGQAAQIVAELPVSMHGQAALPFDHRLASRLEALLKTAFKFGYDQVYAERYRATGRGKNVPVQKLRAAESSADLSSRSAVLVSAREEEPQTLKDRSALPKAAKSPKRDVRFVAEASVSDYQNWATARAKGAAVDLAKNGVEGEQLEKGIGDNLLEGADGMLDRIGIEAARSAVAAGRMDALEELDTEIDRFVRSEVMDKGTEECAEAGGGCYDGDGHEWPSFDEIDWVPGQDCAGNDACRGQVIPVFEDEGVVVLE
jgi:hypothetical protein